jgi:hypothetical protein
LARCSAGKLMYVDRRRTLTPLMRNISRCYGADRRPDPTPIYTLWLFHDVDRRRKLKGWARTWMSHHQILRPDSDQAQRCDGNLPFASRLMALLSMMGHWAGQAFVEGELPFSVSSNGGFWCRKVENALSFNRS